MPAVGLLVPLVPYVTAGVVAVAAIATMAVASPMAFILLVATLSAAIPKAGFLLGEIPVPLMVPLLLISAVMLRPHAGATSTGRRGGRLAALALVWLGYRLVSLHLAGGSPTELLALTGWFGLPIVLFLAGPPLGSLQGPTGDRWTRRLETGVLAACAFSVVQYFWGIERTAIPGFTRAVGADYSLKPLLFQGGSKMPSTYQNGNLLGVITALFFLVSADRLLRGQASRRDHLIMAATAIATLLSGSRTGVIGLVVGLAFLVLRSGISHRTVLICGLGAAAFVGALQLSSPMARRITGTTASDPALAARTAGWSEVLQTTPVAELATGGLRSAHTEGRAGVAEGVIGAVQQVGIIGIALFLSVFFTATAAPEMRRWRLILLPLGVSIAVDSAYLVFPTLFLPIARMFSSIDPSRSPPAPGETRSEPAATMEQPTGIPALAS